MRLLAIPNWSFGRNTPLLNRFRQILVERDVIYHYCESDVDHNRTVTAFSGEEDEVRGALMSLCDAAFDTIDLRKHVGVHPRVGALDVCPFVLLEGEPLEGLAFAEYTASRLAATYELPIFLYEKSERGRHESDLPSLRKGGFGSLAGKVLHPDFGPPHVHPALGLTICGLRDHLIAFNVNFRREDPAFAKSLASKARKLRSNGDERFLGARALGFSLSSKELSQLSINLTLPDLTFADPIVEWAREQADESDVAVAGVELIGVIRAQDLFGASFLPVRPTQVVAA
jgi:glutamate formiminotransferase